MEKERKIHTAPPATATEIRKALGVTAEDLKVVRQALSDLYPKQFPPPKIK